MGASFITTKITSTDEQIIKDTFKDIVEECIYEYGHDPYNGTFSTMSGLKILSKTFDSEQSATDYLADTAKKWEEALAVTIKEEGKDPYTLVGGWAAE